MSDKALLILCLQKWEDDHWLYPGEWYDYIPEGYEVVTITGKKEPFRKGKTDDDIRFGCLPYGFKRNTRKAV